MTPTTQTSRSLPLSSGTGSARGARSTRGLFVAIAVLGIGGAAAGWLLTYRAETPAPGATSQEGMVVDPLSPNAATAANISATVDNTSATAPAAPLGAPVVVGGDAASSATPAHTIVVPPVSASGFATAATTTTSATPATPGATPVALAPAVPTAQLVQQAVSMIGTDPIRARAELTKLLDSNTLSAAERAAAYQGINTLAEQLFFSARIMPGDPVSQSYVVKKGDSLARIAKRENLNVDWRFIQRINAMSSERALHPDQRLKLAYGPFHAEVVKADFRFNLYAGEGAARVMVASFPCGLGENDGTPVGAFKMKPGSKNIDPEWRNPRTGEYFAASDPLNPIGERWIGIAGATPETARFTGFGIHGTVDPSSIGRNASMGCVRLGDAEVQVAYELICDGSTIVIR